MSYAVPSERVDTVRRFNRFYTRNIGILQKGLLGCPLSLTEGRVLYELAQREPTMAATVATELGLDAGYLSRILGAFEKRGLLEKRPSEQDGRQFILVLTDRGREMFATINSRSHDEIAAMLERLSEKDQTRLVSALETAENLLGGARDPGEPNYVLRPHEPGDIGWIIHRHGVLYAQEYGLDMRFEALVARIAADFLDNFDARRERCWIAERDGEIVGSVFLVKKSATVAKLRLLLVEPQARGLGIGRRLVDECLRFARSAGYRKITLWTQNDLYAARHLYALAGFRRVGAERHESFGKKLVAETWELAL
jgi:DNA-binding MarR family transcriptional regulator/N-acetylglutamate synthase-like GNAT family acetyltransferase